MCKSITPGNDRRNPEIIPVKSKTPPRPKVQPPAVADTNNWGKQILKHLRKPSTTRPRTQKRLVSFLIAHLGHKITEVESLALVENLGLAGQAEHEGAAVKRQLHS
jgi:hypothetical protein